MKVLVVRAKGDGGYAEPQTSAYISSKLDSAAPDNEFVRALVEADKVEIVDELGDGSDWDKFQESRKNHMLSSSDEDNLKRYRDEMKNASSAEKKDTKASNKKEPESSTTESAAPGGGPGASAVTGEPKPKDK